MKVMSPPFTFMIAVSLHLVYYLSSHVRLYLSLYFFWRARVELAGSVGGGVRVLKKNGSGENMYSVFEGFFTVSMFI